MSQGVPQGGALPPFLWSLHFNGLRRLIRNDTKSRGGALSGIDLLDIYYADDVALVFAHEDPRVVIGASRMLAEAVRECLRKGGLCLSSPKSSNLAISPGGMTGGVFQRASELSLQAKRDMPKKGASLGRMAGESATEGDLPSQYFPPSLLEKHPFRSVSALTLLFFRTH